MLTPQFLEAPKLTADHNSRPLRINHPIRDPAVFQQSLSRRQRQLRESRDAS
jgi:hypothetical protein